MNLENNSSNKKLQHILKGAYEFELCIKVLEFTHMLEECREHLLHPSSLYEFIQKNWQHLKTKETKTERGDSQRNTKIFSYYLPSSSFCELLCHIHSLMNYIFFWHTGLKLHGFLEQCRFLGQMRMCLHVTKFTILK